jgi:hypothetical protein
MNGGVSPPGTHTALCRKPHAARLRGSYPPLARIAHYAVARHSAFSRIRAHDASTQKTARSYSSAPVAVTTIRGGGPYTLGRDIAQPLLRRTDIEAYRQSTANARGILSLIGGEKRGASRPHSSGRAGQTDNSQNNRHPEDDGRRGIRLS